MISRGTRERLRGIRNTPLGMRLPACPLPRQAPYSGIPTSTSTITLQNGSEVATPLGTYWQCDITMSHLWPEADARLERFLQDRNLETEMESASNAIEQEVEMEDTQRRIHGHRKFKLGGATEQGRRVFLSAFPRQTLFLDLETCGFAGSPIFLAGVIRRKAHDSPDAGGRTVDTEELVLSQLWARNYGEEPALLWGLHQIFAGANVLVTFNGKSFDWPQVVDRSSRHAGVYRLPRPNWLHWDLLHASRRSYKSLVPNCRLQTLERLICGRARLDDLPGHEVPEAYQRYVSQGGSENVDRILHHNALDLVTLVDLSLRLGSVHPNPKR
jgi:uncharacterized protein YprB with RNaseH-like and TPR domain